MTRQVFELGDVLSITTGRFVSRRHIAGVYAVLNFMTGDDLMTHALPRAMNEMLPVILDQHPELAGVDATSVTGENLEEWLAGQEARFGKTIVLTSAPAEHLKLNPLDEPSIKKFRS